MQEHELAGSPAVDTERFKAEVDAAIGAIPERYRRPLVLFHMEDCSLEQTAQQLGLNVKTASWRLVRARELLRAKLVRRGVAVGSVGALTTLLSAEAGAAVLPATFVSVTVKAAGLAAAGKLAAGVTAGTVSANVAALTKGAVNMLFWSSVKTAAIAVVVTGAVVGTGTVVAQKAMESHTRAEVPPAGGQAQVSLTLPVPTVAVSQPVRLANGLELMAFVQAQAPMPIRDNPSKLELGVRVSNPTGEPKEFWPTKTQLMIRWGAGELLAVGEMSNASALPHPISVPTGATQTYSFADAKLAYIGNPRYLAFWSQALRTGAVLEKELRGPSDKIGFAFQYEQDQPSPRTAEIVCSLVSGFIFTEADNGKTVTVPLGQTFEVVVTNGREGAGWEPGATEITGKSVERVDKLRRMNCDSFMPDDPSTNSTKGTYIYRYKTATTGESHLRLTHLYPSGPKPVVRYATQFIGEFKLTVVVRDGGVAVGEAVTPAHLKDWVAFARSGEFQSSDQVKITEEIPPQKPGVWTIRKGEIAGLPIEFNGDKASVSRRVIMRSIPKEKAEKIISSLREVMGKETDQKGDYHSWREVTGGPKATDQKLLQVTINEDRKPGTLVFMVFFGPNFVR